MTRLYADMLSCVAVFITVVLFLGGCVAPNLQATAPTPQVIMQGDIPGKEVVQPIELDNCDGKADAKRTEHRTRSVESTISAEVAAKFGVSAEVLSAEVQATVGASVGWTEGQGTSIELVAPPGTRMAFQLVWIGNEQVGIVQNLRASNIPIAFRSFKPTDVRIKSQYDIGCPGSDVIMPRPTIPQVVAAPTPRTSTEPTASTPKGKYPCPLVVARSQVAAWKVGQTTVAAVNQALDEFAALRPNDAGAFMANTEIPSGVLIATDFGEATGWTRYPVAPVIHSGGWGLFESTGEYTAPKPGACMTIGP